MTRPFQWSSICRHIRVCCSMCQSHFPHRLSSITCWSLILVKLSMRKLLSMQVNYLASNRFYRIRFGFVHRTVFHRTVSTEPFSLHREMVCVCEFVWRTLFAHIRCVHWFFLLFFFLLTRDHPLFVAIDYFRSYESVKHESFRAYQSTAI